MTFKSKSAAGWIDDLAALETHIQANPLVSRSERKKALGHGDTHLTKLLAIKACFDPAAIAKVRLAEKADPPYILSLNGARALADLKNRISDLPAALDVVLTRHLAPRQIEALVEWVIAGNPAETFDPQTKPSKPPKIPHTATLPSTPADIQLAQLFKKVEESTGGDKIKAQEQLVAYVMNQSESKENERAPVKSSRSKKLKSGSPSLLLELAAGINPFSQLKSKIKKGGDLTRGDWGLLFLENLGKFLHWLKHPFKWIHAIFKFIGKVVIDALKTLGIYNFVKSVVTLALVALLLWGAWDMRQHGFWHPVNLVRYRFFSHSGVEAQPEAVPTAAVIVESPKDKTENKRQASPSSGTSQQPPAGISHPPVMAFVEGSDAQETKPYLEQELSGIPPNSIIKACVFQPDFTMSGDMAYRRLMDLQDKKYSVRWGNDKVTVVSLTPTASNLMLKVQSGLDSLLTGASKADFYWEDVRQFHCDEIETTPNGKPTKTIYQCSLFLAENKKPITVQCATTADLIHLVSALEYYLRLSRGTSAPPVLIGGLPYLNQGLRLNNEGVVTVLWAFSPLAKTGLALGDILWSVGKNTDHQQDKTQLESALQNLTSGAYTLYKVTADGWKRAWANRVQDDPDSFHPLRRKILLMVN